MTIEASNLLTMLSAAEGVTAMSAAPLPAGGENPGFSAALMQQLGLLQASLANLPAQPLPTPISDQLTNLPADAQVAMQSFAALFGKNLPMADKVEQNIDLDDTMQTLADVMQHLQALETSAANPQQELVLESKPLPTKSVPINESEQQVMAAESEQPMPLTPQSSPLPLPVQAVHELAVEVVEHKADTASEATEREPAAVPVLDQSPALVPAPVPVPAQVAVSPMFAAMQSEESVESVVPNNSGLLALAKKAITGAAVSARDGQVLPAVVTEEGGDFDQEFERSIAALLQAGGNSSEHAGQNGAQSGAQTGLARADNPLLPVDSTSSNNTGNANPLAGEKLNLDFSAELNELSQALPPVAAATKVAVPAVATPLGHSVWNEELGQKLIWMHKQAMPSAELRLNPEHLGPVLVKIDVHQDQTSISFTAQHQVVRDAIEAAIPKLREMFSGQQLQLADVNVSQHQQQSEQRQPRDFFQAASEQGRGRQGNANELLDGEHGESLAIVDEIEAGRAIAGNGLLSLFA